MDLLRRLFLPLATLAAMNCRKVCAGPVYEPVASFNASPQVPSRGALLLIEEENAFFGTSVRGGGAGKGTIYRVSRSGDVTTLVHFTGFREQYPGTGPRGGLWHDGNGWLWGTAELGGGSDDGTLFKYNFHTGTMITLVEFNGNNGAGPECRLQPDGLGYLWGTTSRGGTKNFGTVFRIRISDGAFASLISFTGVDGAAPGNRPHDGLTPDGAGYLWGITALGGITYGGAIFKIHIASGDYAHVMNFPAQPVLESVNTQLVNDGNGYLWGTSRGAFYGPGSDGAVFKMHAATGVLSVVHAFTEAITGSRPYAGLVDDGAGNLWGTTTQGLSGMGGVFSIRKSTGVLTVVDEFTGATGYGCMAPLTNGGDGTLWGTGLHGGPVDAGAIFKVTPRARPMALTAVKVLDETLPPVRGRSPNGGFIRDAEGLLWSTTFGHGTGNQYGTIFTCNPATGELKNVVEFTGNSGAAPGSNPNGLMSDGAGWYWGVTYGGGSTGHGTVFKVNPVTRAFHTVYTLTGTSGPYKGNTPDGRLVRAGAWLWGSTRSGGLWDKGTIFKLHPYTGEFYTVHEWAEADGNGPNGGLASDGTGSLWGVTTKSGKVGGGTVFKISTGIVTYTEVSQFSSSQDGPRDFPVGPLTADGSGRMWGVTKTLFGSTGGMLYFIRISDGARHSYQPFSSLGGSSSPGGEACGGLMNDGHGNLWGITRYGSSFDYGAVFRIPVSGPGAGTVTWSLPLSGYGWPAPGAAPATQALTMGDDGHIYGALHLGGTGGYGQIFRLRYGPAALTQPADNIGYTTAVLHGLVNPHGQVSTAGFDISGAPDLASAQQRDAGSTSSGSFYQSISASLTGLLPGTTYYFRARASNAENPFPQTGQILSFTTRKPGLADWLLDNGITGAPAAPAADPDGDGISNALEYLAGSNPSAVSSPDPAGGSFNRTDYTVSFRRADISETPDISLTVEAGSDLVQWPYSYLVGADTATSTPGVTVTENGRLHDTVKVRLPAGHKRLYWRIKVTVTP